MSCRRASVGASVLACAAGLGWTIAPLAPVLGAAPVVAVAEGGDCASVRADNTDERTVTGTNDANEQLQIAQAQALARAAGVNPGAGVGVVVVDTGSDDVRSTAPSARDSGHGLTVAGIIAGPDQPSPPVAVGIAPGAQVVGVPFYDVPYGQGEDGLRVPMAGALAGALNAVADQRASGVLGERTVVVVPTQVPRDPALSAAVERLTRTGVLLIAAAGDRLDEDSFLSAYAQARKGQDSVADVWPAAAPDVLSVGASDVAARGVVLRNSGIDLSAPGVGSVSKALNGGWCVVAAPSSAWAAAQVAGVAALVWSVHGGDTAAELRTRLLQTASGNGEGSSPITGYGVVQPVEAVQRREVGMVDRSVEENIVPRAQAPEKQADVLAEARTDAVWWGLTGGAVLLALVLLRPVLARRR